MGATCAVALGLNDTGEVGLGGGELIGVDILVDVVGGAAPGDGMAMTDGTIAEIAPAVCGGTVRGKAPKADAIKYPITTMANNVPTADAARQPLGATFGAGLASAPQALQNR